jgi:hypothetical protein
MPLPTPSTHWVNGNATKPPFPAGMETALFGLGCFWGAERKFWQVPRVYSTAVGYAGGPTAPMHAPAQRCRHPIPLGHLRRVAGAQKRAARASRDAYQEELYPAGHGGHLDRDRGRPAILLHRGLSPAISGKESK